MDFSKVTSLQIPEGNVTKIEDKEGNILWANINKVAYGVRWNSVNQATTACERIGNLELHKTLPIQSRFKVCIHKGKEIQYYCNPNDSRFVDFDNTDNRDEINKINFSIDKDSLRNLFYFGSSSQGATSLDDESANNYYVLVTDNKFSNYRWLYAYVKITGSDKNIYIGRIIKIDVSTKQATIELNEDLDSMQPFTNIELGCSINGYDGEIGVDTGGKFYQWSIDNDGDNNEVWQSLYKCVPYAREIKRHIIGIDRACVLNIAFNDTKWGWIGGLEANTAVNVINYHTNLRGGTNSNTFDEYLGVDNFRCQLGKARTNITINTARTYSRKTDGGQVLYKQIWEAIVWSYIIEYADFDVKKTYTNSLTTEGYHQGGLGNGVIGGTDLENYNNNEKLVPNDYTLELGNNTSVKTRVSKENQTAWNVPHWRGFNVFWYGDVSIAIDNALNKYDVTKQKRIWYYTDDVTKFNNITNNKEHQIEGLDSTVENWLKEVRINNKGDIVPIETSTASNYKNSYNYDYTITMLCTTFIGGTAILSSKCGLLCFQYNIATTYLSNCGFVKVTVLDT